MAVVQRVKLEVRPLFLPQLVRLVNMLTPGLKRLTWVDINWKPFITNVSEAIENFNILVSNNNCNIKLEASVFFCGNYTQMSDGR